MRYQSFQRTVTATSPSSPGTAAAAATFASSDLHRADVLVVDAELVGATGGTLDVYLQTREGTDWIDLAHFPQLASGATARAYTFCITGDGLGALAPVGRNLSPALAANVNTNRTPRGELRLLFVAGTGTSAGASQSVMVTAYRKRCAA